MCFIYLHYKKCFSRQPSQLPLLFFFHPPSKEFNETGKIDVQDGCRSDSYPFFTEQMDGCGVAQSHLASGSLLCCLSHVINHMYSKGEVIQLKNSS